MWSMSFELQMLSLSDYRAQVDDWASRLSELMLPNPLSALHIRFDKDSFICL